MNRWWQLGAAALLGAAVALAGCLLLLNTGGRGMKIAMVDMEKILDESAPAKSLNDKLNSRAKELDAALSKISDSSQKAAKRAEYQQELTDLQKEYAAQVVNQADQVLARLAKRQGIQAVFSKGGTPYGNIRYAPVDLTGQVMKEMK